MSEKDWRPKKGIERMQKALTEMPTRMSLAKRLRTVFDGFVNESLNGVVCSIPDEGVDTPNHRTWCKRCQIRWKELRAIVKELEDAEANECIYPRAMSEKAERQPLDARAHMGDGDSAAREAGAEMRPAEAKLDDYSTWFHDTTTEHVRSCPLCGATVHELMAVAHVNWHNRIAPEQGSIYKNPNCTIDHPGQSCNVACGYD